MDKKDIGVIICIVVIIIAFVGFLYLFGERQKKLNNFCEENGYEDYGLRWGCFKIVDNQLIYRQIDVYNDRIFFVDREKIADGWR